MSQVRLGQGGVPDWLQPMIRFCSRCGTPLEFGPVSGEDRQRLACPSCGFIFYVNPRLVVTTLPITERGEVILIKRGIEPGLGMWAQPGGFLEIDETVHEAAIRETLEETGLEVEPGAIVGFVFARRRGRGRGRVRGADPGRRAHGHARVARNAPVRSGIDPLDGDRLRDEPPRPPRLGRPGSPGPAPAGPCRSPPRLRGLSLRRPRSRRSAAA